MSEPYTIERYESREEWLQARKRGIGASESAAVLGYEIAGAYKSAYSIATDKLTDAIDPTPQSEEAYWGTADEPTIAARFAKETGMTVTDPGDFTIFRSVEHPWLFCTPDRLMLPMSVLEIKETFGENGKAWHEDVPRPHKVQLQQTMQVLGVPVGYFAARINWFGVEFRFHPMRRSDKFWAWAFPRLKAFWESIQRGEMPDIDGSLATARALAQRYDKPEPTPVELPDELETLGQEYDRLTEAESKAKRDKELIKNKVKAALGNHAIGVLPDLTGFSWSANGKGTRTLRRLEKVRVENA